jgi:hypothetical protein
MSDRGRYRKLYVRLWRHPGFVGLNDGDKTVALYVLTGPQSNRLGLYVLSVATAAEDLGMTPETLRKRLSNVCVTFGWLFDSEARVVYLPSWWWWNPPENDNVLKGNLKDLNDIPPCALVDAFARNVETLSATFHETFLEGLRQRLPQPSSNQKHYQGSGSEKQKREPAALRAEADNGDRRGTVPQRHIEIARTVLTETPGQGTEYLIDAFQCLCRNKGIVANREAAIAALTAAR